MRSKFNPGVGEEDAWVGVVVMLRECDGVTGEEERVIEGCITGDRRIILWLNLHVRTHTFS